MSAWQHRLILTAVAMAAAGCAVGPNYQPPVAEVPAHWSAAADAGAAAVSPQIAWWKVFKDPELDALIDRAACSNLDLRLAESRIREARAQRGVAVAARWPALDAGASVAREKDSLNAPAPVLALPDGSFESTADQPEALYQAGFDASWELDLFGGVRRSVEAEQASLDATMYDRKAVLLSLLGEVARNYIGLRGSQQQLELAHRALDAQQDRVELVGARVQGGMASALEEAAVQAQAKTAEARIPPLEAARDQAIYRLSVLTGQPPVALADELAPVRPIPAATPQLPATLPSDLLRQRPDLRRAERQVAAATARIGVATAELYPRFSLLGTAGLASVSAGDFFQGASSTWSIGPSIRWPILQRGQIVRVIEVRQAQEQQALIRYRQAILTALEDAENALSAYQRERERRPVLAEAVRDDEQALAWARGVYQGGLSDFRAVREAQGQLLLAQSEQARSEAAISEDLVAVYKALGGGWEVESLPAGDGG